MRPSGRAPDELRPVRITRGYTRHAEGSVLVEFGDTRVLVTASVEDGVPGFLRGKGEGWVTAEYGMLPRSTHTRSAREAARGKQGGRTLEIQRLIGRSLRAVVDLRALGERTVTLDCDVLQADGGTRTASITGAYVALADAMGSLVKRRQLAAISAARPGRRHFGGNRAWRTGRRPRLRRGFERRNGHERRHEQRRRLRRSAGHRRGARVPSPRTRPAARSRRRGLRALVRAAARGVAGAAAVQRDDRHASRGHVSCLQPATPASCARCATSSRRGASKCARSASLRPARPTKPG